MITLDIYLVNSQTGENRAYTETYKDDDVVEFLWTEGNYSCDCNRSIFLYDWDENRELPCSRETNVIGARGVVRETGVILFDDIGGCCGINDEKEKQ